MHLFYFQSQCLNIAGGGSGRGGGGGGGVGEKSSFNKWCQEKFLLFFLLSLGPGWAFHPQLVSGNILPMGPELNLLGYSESSQVDNEA